jgi:hypothetical protein
MPLGFFGEEFFAASLGLRWGGAAFVSLALPPSEPSNLITQVGRLLGYRRVCYIHHAMLAPTNSEEPIEE